MPAVYFILRNFDSHLLSYPASHLTHFFLPFHVHLNLCKLLNKYFSSKLVLNERYGHSGVTQFIE